jgi:hypothetical protein
MLSVLALCESSWGCDFPVNESSLDISAMAESVDCLLRFDVHILPVVLVKTKRSFGVDGRDCQKPKWVQNEGITCKCKAG